MAHEPPEEKEQSHIIQLHPGYRERTYTKTIIDSARRHRHNDCPHKGPYLVDRKLAAVECQECGAYLNPLYVLEKMAAQETYWNQRLKDLIKYVEEVQDEIKERTRTKCTHCGNMTAIKFRGEIPRTWTPGLFD
jgi:DNA-directed RNA polymerase subunit M/transcription elongation factor TFIIS